MEPMYRKILVPIDDSGASGPGLKEAIRIAKNQQAKLRILHVVHDFLVAAGQGGAVYASQLRKDLEVRGQRILQDALGLARAEQVDAETSLLEAPTGSVGSIIVEEAQNWKPDLIVLGTHGRRGIRRLVMGSDAEQVVRMTPVPVLLIRSVEEKH